jgi:hypothetical protein
MLSAITTNSAKATKPPPIKSKRYFMFTLPKNKITREVMNSTAAVEKLAGSIKPQIKTIGSIRGKKPCLKSLTN